MKKAKKGKEIGRASNEEFFVIIYDIAIRQFCTYVISMSAKRSVGIVGLSRPTTVFSFFPTA